MLIKQLSVFLENKPGRLAAALEELGKNDIDISALSLADTSEYGILRLIVSNPEKAAEVLKNSGVVVKLTDVLALAIDDTPGGLSQILSVFTENAVNIDYMYAFVSKVNSKALTVVKVSDPQLAEQALSALDISTVKPTDIYRL